MRDLNIKNKWVWVRMSVVVIGGGFCLFLIFIGSVVDWLYFNVDGMVIVWVVDVSGIVLIVLDFIIENGGVNMDLINGDVYMVVMGLFDVLDEFFLDGVGVMLWI